MPHSALAYTIVPIAAALMGALLAILRRPSPIVVSAVQHFAAGVVFAAAAVEILPQVKHANAVWPVVIGGALGVAAMLGLRALGERMHGRVGLISLIGVDIFIDGVVLGLAFAAGEKAGLLLTFALTIEVLFLALSLSGELGDDMRGARLFALTAGIVLMMPLGVLASTPLAAASPTFVTGAFAFGLVALLYLVTEELLVSAHEVEDRPWATALFFVGFLLLLVLEDIAA
jgi:ZIP family zinc transporter